MRLIALATVLAAFVVLVPARAGAQLVVDNVNGTVTDTKTGKMWVMKPSALGTKKWDDARTFLETFNFAGNADWKLPAGGACTGTCSSADLPKLFLPYGLLSYAAEPFQEVTGLYWTDSQSSSDATKAISFNSEDPAQNPDSKTGLRGVWPVRDVPGGATSVPIDVWITDCKMDQGSVPSSSVCPQNFASADIFIDNDDDGVIDAPAYGGENRFKARIRNKSTAWAMRVVAHFRLRKCADGAAYSSAGSTVIGDAWFSSAPGSQKVVETTGSVPASGEWCVFVVLDQMDDRQPTPTAATDLHDSNNIAAASLDNIANRAGKEIGTKTVWFGRFGWVVLIMMAVSITYWLTRYRYRPRPQ